MSASPEADLRRSGAHQSPERAKKSATPHPQPEFVDIDTTIEDKDETDGAGENVLIRNKYVREQTGTYETLKILDDSMIDTEEEEGIDPYNTGQFDRSKNWDKRRK